VREAEIAEIGLLGLGTMGGALALNLAERGTRVALSDIDPDRAAGLVARAGPLAERLHPAGDLAALVDALATPRVVLLTIPSGDPVAQATARLAELLAPGDIIVDAGNSDFRDTMRREAELAERGIAFVGLGVSGGAEGARHGPSMMLGGSAAAWDRLRPLLQPAAARFRGDPCLARVGPDGAGHFVKTVHNGIEYADMQMIAEIYGLLRDGTGWPAPRIGRQFAQWGEGRLSSFLIEATAAALRSNDPETGHPMVDVIHDSAGQKGTGRWTVIEAQRLGQSASTIEAAVGARAWSADKGLREVAAERLPRGRPGGALPPVERLGRALLAGRILSHAQGFALLGAASQAHGWSLDLARIAEIWRAGCIIRSALLDDLAGALRAGGSDMPLILAPELWALLTESVAELRETVTAAMSLGLPVPALAAALSWYDSLRQARGTANLIQAQRDFFGQHGFARTDRDGVFHGHWRREG